MCRTILIFNVHCEHEHAEIQKCSDIVASDAKWQRKGFFSKMFSSPPRSCRRPQQTRSHTKAQIRRDRDYALRRPPRPIYRHQTDLGIDNPVFPPEPQSNAMRQPADRRPQGLQRSNTVQFQGEAPRLPNVRATAIFRESQNLDPDTLRQYLGSAGVPFESPEISAYQRPPVFPSANHNQRTRDRSNNRQTRPNTRHPHDNDSSLYMDRPLPPAPLRPRRAMSSTYRPPPVPSRYSSQRPFRLSSQQQQLALTGPRPESPPLAPSYHLGMPTDRELNRMSREIESVESAWVNASRRPSQQQPVVRQSTGSLAAPRRHRSQREGKYA